MNWNKEYYISNYLEDIEFELRNGRIIPAFVMSLTVPDICVGENKGKKEYIEWCKDWIIAKIYPDEVLKKKAESGDDENYCAFNETDFYLIRCAFLHSGVPAKNTHLSLNSVNDVHLGHVICTITDNLTDKTIKTVQINLNQFIEDVVKCAKAFIKDSPNNNRKLFNLIDYDKINP